MREEESEDFAKLNNYKKTKDKIYYKTGFKNNLFFYEIFLPESSKVILLTGDKETYELFCSYSTQLMAAVRKDRKYGSGYFIRKNGIVCNPQID